MKPTENLLNNFFNEAKRDFLTKEANNIISGVNERNLAARLAIHFDRLLNKYSLTEYEADAEYNRMQEGKIKTMLDEKECVITINCDIILHSRGKSIESDNLIAVELKKSTRSEEEKDSDKKRLRALTKDSFHDSWSYDGETHTQHVCRYMLGVYMEFNISNRNVMIEYYRKGSKVSEWSETF